jgi:hypothetical protein
VVGSGRVGRDAWARAARLDAKTKGLDRQVRHGMTHGPDAVHRLIEDSGWSYPVSVTRLEREHPLANVTMNERGDSIMLVELLSEVEADSFGSRSDLEATLEPIFEEISRDRNPGVVTRVKRLFLGNETGRDE